MGVADNVDIDAIPAQRSPRQGLADLDALDPIDRHRLAGQVGQSAGDPQAAGDSARVKLNIAISRLLIIETALIAKGISAGRASATISKKAVMTKITNPMTKKQPLCG